MNKTFIKKRSVTVLKCMPCRGIVMSFVNAAIYYKASKEKEEGFSTLIAIFKANFEALAFASLYKFLMLKFKLLWM